MAQTILNGDNKTIQDHYTGPENELSVDESNRNLRLHDGVTPGGHEIMSRNNADARYQPYSPELDGLNAFEPQQRGFPARLGPADYRLRSISYDADNLIVTNPDGYAGNPTFSLAATIASSHTWTGQHIATDVWEFQAGINADVSGDTTGVHTGNVVGNVTGNLTGNSVGTHTGPAIGSIDTRGAAVQFDVGQIPLAALAGLLAYVQANGLPTGAIIMWSGSVASIPAGFFLCNGANSTPDMRDRFVVAAGGTYAPGATGGSGTHSHTIATTSSGVHTHTPSADAHALTQAQIPAHTHLMVVDGISNDPTTATSGISAERTLGGDTEYRIMGNEGARNRCATSSIGAGVAHSHTVTEGSDGSHTHTGTSNSVDSRPLYYAVCFIMKG